MRRKGIPLDRAAVIMPLMEYTPNKKVRFFHQSTFLWLISLLILAGYQSVHIFRLEAQVTTLSNEGSGDQPSLPQERDGTQSEKASVRFVVKKQEGGELPPGRGAVRAAGDSASTISESFTWNTKGCQTWSRQHHQRPKGLVVTLILTPDNRSSIKTLRNTICRSLPSQLSHLVGPQRWDMLLLVSGNQKNKTMPLEAITQCLSLSDADKVDANKEWHNLDGTTVTTTEYRWNNQVSIFLGHVQVAWPEYIQNDMSILKQKIEPDHCNQPKSYIQGTRWYSNELLHLAILQEYQWFIKLDIDVFFVRTVEWSLLHDLQARNSLFAHTAEYPEEMGKECSLNIVHAMQSFVAESKDRTFCDIDNPLFKLDRDQYYTNFIIGRVDFWTQPAIRELGRYLSEYRAGFFLFRWTDQIFWHQALGLLAHVDASTVTDYTELRCSVERNCWKAVFYYYLYGEQTHDVCDNDAYFMHTKNTNIFQDREVTHTGDLWQSDRTLHTLSYKDECSEKLSQKQNEVTAKKAANQGSG